MARKKKSPKKSPKKKAPASEAKQNQKLRKMLEDGAFPSLSTKDEHAITKMLPGERRIPKPSDSKLEQVKKDAKLQPTECRLEEGDPRPWLERLHPLEPTKDAKEEELARERRVAASVAERAILCCFNPRADRLTCHATRGTFDALREARVVFMPTLPCRGDKKLPNYLRGDRPPDTLVVLVVEVDIFAQNIFEPLYEQEDYYFLVLPHRRGIPFARHAALTFSRELKMRDIFFIDDDIKLTSHDGKTLRSFSDALTTLRKFGRAVNAAVVGTYSARHTKFSNPKKKLLASRSCQMDFRCVYLNVNICESVDFLHKDARNLPRAKWDELLQIRGAKPKGPATEEVQKTFFQGEDFGYCEKLAHLNDLYPRSYVICSLYAKDVKAQPSMAGTTGSDGGSPPPAPALLHIDEAKLEGVTRCLFPDEAEEFESEKMEPCCGYVKHDSGTKKLKLHYKSKCGGNFAKCSGKFYTVPVPTAALKEYTKCLHCWPSGNLV